VPSLGRSRAKRRPKSLLGMDPPATPPNEQKGRDVIAYVTFRCQLTMERRTTKPDESHLRELHIAEWNALMTRNTYLVTIQFSLWPVLVIFLTLASQVWGQLPKEAAPTVLDQNHRILIWAILAAIQMIGVGWVQLIWEQLSNIRYLEKNVRPFLVRTGLEPRFWLYEAYLVLERGSRFAGDYWLTASSLTVIPLVIVRLFPFSVTDYIGLAVNAILGLFLERKTRDVMNLRRTLAAELPTQLVNGWRDAPDLNKPDAGLTNP
jgi:hypothetical protein